MTVGTTATKTYPQRPTVPGTPPNFNALKRRLHWLKYKHAIANAFARAGHDALAKQIHDCQSVQLLALCSACGAHWYVPYSCRKRVCPICSYKVSKKRAAFIQALTRNMKYPKMLTLTMPRWTGNPQAGIDTLRKHVNTLREHDLFKGVIGGAYQIELKAKPDGWHIHAHMIIDGPYIAQPRLFSVWRIITGIQVPQVDIRAADSDAAKEYVSKYAAKSAGFERNLDAVVDWYFATHNRRLFTTFGKWYNVKIEDLDDEALPQAKPFTCPQCNATGSCFYARDGPFIYGGQHWNDMQHSMIGNLDVVRDDPEYPISHAQQRNQQLEEAPAWTDATPNSDESTSTQTPL
jgi:hypothetical protein